MNFAQTHAHSIDATNQKTLNPQLSRRIIGFELFFFFLNIGLVMLIEFFFPTRDKNLHVAHREFRILKKKKKYRQIFLKKLLLLQWLIKANK